MSGLEEVRAELAALRADVDALTELRAEVAELRAQRDEVARLRAETADTRALAAMADRDAADVRASLNGITRAQNALRETQVEQGHTLREIAGAVGVLVQGQQRHEEMLAELLRRLPEHEG